MGCVMIVESIPLPLGSSCGCDPQAYEVLSSDDKRAQYDRFGHAGVDANGAGGPGGDPFEAFRVRERTTGVSNRNKRMVRLVP